MRYALIDIGSNTVRLVIYEAVGGGKAKIILNTADYSGILSYVKEGRLCDEGFIHLSDVLKKMNDTVKEYGCNDLYAFATASLRDISDKKMLVEHLKNTSGVDIHMLTGEREAYYDCMGLRSEFDIKNGAAFDLGGGSCQLMYLYNGKVMECESMPIGSLRLYNRFVRDTLPDENEIKNIRSHIRSQLSGLGLLYRSEPDVIYAMGGAARAVMTVLAAVTKRKTPVITRAELLDMLTLPEELFRMTIPERLTTIIPAIITMLEILDFAAADKIHVTDVGVRDGILYEMIKR